MQRIAAAATGVVVLDCLGPVLGALGLDENSNTDVGRFLGAFAELLDEAGAPEAAVVHHMGHSGERTRGGSKLRDWPDASGGWSAKTTTRPRPGSSPRSGVTSTRRRASSSSTPAPGTCGSRAVAAVAAAAGDIVKVVRATPGVNTRTLRSAVEAVGHPQHVVREALAAVLAERWWSGRKARAGLSSTTWAMIEATLSRSRWRIRRAAGGPGPVRSATPSSLPAGTRGTRSPSAVRPRAVLGRASRAVPGA